jgi:nucleoid DNA-binding protein
MELQHQDFSERLFAQLATLLYDNNKVILPYFGAFVGNYCPAQLLFGTNQIAPAKKQLVFDPQQTENDNLFINAFALSNQFDHQTAEKLVNSWVEMISTQLLEQRNLNFEKVGLLYFNNEAKLELKQSETNFWKPSEGLPLLPALAILREKSTFLPPPINEPKIKQEKVKKTVFWSANKIALAGFLVILLPVGVYFAYQKYKNSGETENLIAQTDSLTVNANIPAIDSSNSNPNTDNSNANTDNSNANTDNSNTNTDNSNTNTDNSNTNTDNSNTNTDNSNTNTDNSNTNTDNFNPNTDNSNQVAGAKEYVIIVGAFSEAKNAKKMRRRLEKEGYFIDLATTYAGYARIGVQISCLPSELNLHLKEIRRKFSSKSWILKK